jgi:tRNA-splicing ligase RtcB
MRRINNRLISWASIIDDKTLEQAKLTASLPFIHPHLALMPDAHLGMGATVGSVIPTDGAVIPAAVGVDIGCGMIAVRTQFERADLWDRSLEPLRRRIEKAVPVSAGVYNTDITDTAAIRIRELDEKRGVDTAERLAPNWRNQLGTLGSGNHFIEVTLDEQDRVWCFLHSGSRGVGNKIAQHHIKVAKNLCKRWWIDLPGPDLAYLVEGVPEFGDYIRDLHWAQRFAYLNREEMMDRVIDALSEFAGKAVEVQEQINCHHNYTERERHFGKEVWLSRKGAIDAAKGVGGLIPGSMGTASYVVEGKGYAPSLNSSPHGAGRVHSRTSARKTFTVEQLREAMAGIEYRDTDAFIDEIPAAYKDIDVVMDDAADLVEVKHTLHQIVNVKGD